MSANYDDIIRVFPNFASVLGGVQMVRYSSNPNARVARITLANGREVRVALSALPQRETWTAFNLADAAAKVSP